MSILDSLKEVFSGGGGGSSDTVVGIDIGSSYIKVAQIKKNSGRIVLETYGSVALGPYEEEARVAGELTNLSEEKLSEALGNLLTQANVTTKKPVISISSSASLIFTLSLPNVDRKNLDGVVKSEARKYIPIPLTEVSLDWWVIPEQEVYGDQHSDDKHVDVLVVAVRNELVEKYSAIVSSLKQINSPQYEIETFSAIRGSFKHELSPVLIIDFGASGTRMAVVEHGVIKKFHSVNRGAAYLTSSMAKSLEIEFEEAEKLKRKMNIREDGGEDVEILKSGFNYVFSEIQNVIFDFEKDHKKPVSKILLTGGGALLGGLQQDIQERYNIHTDYADPFGKVVSPEFLEDILQEAGPEFAVALGLALQSVN